MQKTTLYTLLCTTVLSTGVMATETPERVAYHRSHMGTANFTPNTERAMKKILNASYDRSKSDATGQTKRLIGYETAVKKVDLLEEEQIAIKQEMTELQSKVTSLQETTGKLNQEAISLKTTLSGLELAKSQLEKNSETNKQAIGALIKTLGKTQDELTRKTTQAEESNIEMQNLIDKINGLKLRSTTNTDVSEEDLQKDPLTLDPAVDTNPIVSQTKSNDLTSFLSGDNKF
ncbi:MAG: hypothetical protein ABFQ95_02335 [Pseudomonadota bacterium]